jgi:hypothetical protein
MTYPGEKSDSYDIANTAGRVENLPHPLAEIKRFITVTDATTKQQLYYLALSRPLRTPEAHQELDDQLTADIEDNVAALGQVLPLLGRMGMLLSITDPETNIRLPLAGISYSTKAVGYQAAVFINKEPVILPLDPELLDARSAF